MIVATTGGVEVGAAPSPSTVSSSSSAFGPSTAPPGYFQYDSTSPGPAVGEKRKEDLPHSSQQRPVVVKCLVKTECSSRSAGSPITSFLKCVRRRTSTTFASVRECLVPCQSRRSPRNHRRSMSFDAGRNYRTIVNFNFNLS